MIQGRKCFLRALEPSDVTLLYNWENDVNVWKYGSTTRPVSQSEIEALVFQADLDIYQTRQMRLMICHDNDTVGCIDLFDFDPFNMRGAVGILISEDYRDKGYASDALDAFVNYLFSVLHLHQVYATTLDNNIASIRLFSSCGFSQCGVRRQWLRTTDGYSDEVIMQKINE